MHVWGKQMTIQCPACKVDMKFTIWKSTKIATWLRRADCPQCHGRIYGDVGQASPVAAIVAKVKQYCDCCHFDSEKLFPVDTLDWDLVCETCKTQIEESKELEQIFNKRINNAF